MTLININCQLSIMLSVMCVPVQAYDVFCSLVPWLNYVHIRHKTYHRNNKLEIFENLMKYFGEEKSA